MNLQNFSNKYHKDYNHKKHRAKLTIACSILLSMANVPAPLQ